MNPKAKINENNIPAHWFDKGVALDALRYHFRQGTDTIRIASGFFSMRGYSLIRGSASGKKLLILVGVKEPGEDRLKRVLINEIKADLRKGVLADRRQVVEELVAKMEGDTFRIVSARAMDHHAKLYIIDDTIALIGSSNLSENGLKKVIEAGYTVITKDHVKDYSRWYDEYFFSTLSTDITQILLDALKKWLELSTPWHIYLKTLDALRALDEPTALTRPNYRHPVSYQRNIVAQALRSIERHRGVMVIASTGLGKTVMGTDIALRLKEAGHINTVLIIGPEAVRESWHQHFMPTGIYIRFFNPSALNAESAKQNQYSRELQNILEILDEQWLVIFDESHNFRKDKQDVFENGQKYQKTKNAFKRILPSINKRGAKVLLMTATPLSTDIGNINSQLLLLPHTAPNSGKLPLPGYTDELFYPNAWRIRRLSRLKNNDFDVVVSLTTPHVAKDYATEDENGERYIEFNEVRKYIPQIILHRVNVPLPLEDEIITLLKNDYFRTTSKHPMYRTYVERLIRTHWASSPWALRDVISRSIHRKGWKPYKGKFKLDEQLHRQRNQYDFDFRTHLPNRTKRLSETIKKLETMSFNNDIKLQTLIFILGRLVAEGKKAIIFAENHATVAYLEMALKTLRPAWTVASLVSMTAPGNYTLKTKKENTEILRHFAPIANDRPMEDGRYTFLLATDAYGVGVNMQDAQAVINYDLSWTPIAPVQRAGRVLRFWRTPREVELFSFVPTISKENNIKEEARKFNRRWRRLTQRNELSREIIDLKVLATENDTVNVDILSLATGKSSVSIESAELDIVALDNEEYEATDVIPVSPIFRHLSHLEKPREREILQSLPDDISSAMIYSGKSPLVYVLLYWHKKYIWVVYNLKKRELVSIKTELELLNLLECDDTTPTANIPSQWIEKAGNKCVKTWCNSKDVKLEDVERICMLYLTPDEKDDFIQLFD